MRKREDLEAALAQFGAQRTGDASLSIEFMHEAVTAQNVALGEILLDIRDKLQEIAWNTEAVAIHAEHAIPTSMRADNPPLIRLSETTNVAEANSLLNEDWILLAVTPGNGMEAPRTFTLGKRAKQ